MSDHWEQFTASMGGRAVVISYDHGVRDLLACLPFANFAGFKVELLAPNELGLPQGDEFQKLNEVEDLLRSQIEPNSGLHVGRISTNGCRYFHFYCSLTDEAIDALAAAAQKLHGHGVLVSHEPDPERSHYWNDLYPTDDDWQVMKDMKVQSALIEKGDSLSQPPPIRHCIYFTSSHDREHFAQSMAAHFEKAERSDRMHDQAEFGLVLTHVGLPDYRSMNPTTMLLSRAARQCDATYDGWETEVRAT